MTLPESEVPTSMTRVGRKGSWASDAEDTQDLPCVSTQLLSYLFMSCRFSGEPPKPLIGLPLINDASVVP